LGALWITAAVALPAQTFTTLHSFDNTDGSSPGALIQATDGSLYGTTASGGTDGDGTVFKITTDGTLTTLHSFDGTDGLTPSGLVQANNGKLYGTTTLGGTHDGGTIFEITLNGALTTLYNFCSGGPDCTDGARPTGLIQGADGNFYGTASEGGAHSSGSVFQFALRGGLNTLHSFCSRGNCTDGQTPEAALVQATNGKLYGTTLGGGTPGEGTVFKITAQGAFATLYNFCSQTNCMDGAEPDARLIQGNDGNLYGTTNIGGDIPETSDGTVFKISVSGALTTLYSFDGTDGFYPAAGLVQGTDGTFYGTTYDGGISNATCSEGCGTIYKITSSGALTTLYSFCSLSNCADGHGPLGGIIQDTNGSFYGTTEFGGTSDLCSNGCGTVFSLSVGLGSFLNISPTSGTVGKGVSILGTDLSGASKVTFHGTSATFTVISGSEITTTVPTGATTGLVKVVTPGGTLSSNVPFRVVP
jgi:uncharacterized repeat protein (TIGR03803 family)